MPSITFSFDDLCSLVGKKLSEAEFTRLLDCAKAELDAKLTTEVTVKFNDTNQPYLWSVEGLARLFKGLLGKEKGIPSLALKKSKEKVIYDKRLKKTRPYVACFIAKGKKIEENFLKQLIQLQEKLADNFGKHRQKFSIGMYPLKKIAFPVSFKAAAHSEKFVPLGFHEQLTLKEVLEKHPKGKEFGALLKQESFYPIFVDAQKKILSLVPIINSEETGKLEPGDTELFFETTGTDEEAVNLATTIVAYALADRDFTVEALTVEYPEKKVVTPSTQTKSIKLNEEQVAKLLGITLKPAELKNFLESMRYNYQAGTVTIPSYRHDIMHVVDVIEDIAILYGYSNFEPLPLTAYTTGKTSALQQRVDMHRMLWVGLGFQEVLSAVLSNKDLLYGKMHVADQGTIEIENYVSITYSCVRTWILPVLMDILSKNKHVEYPQKIFEEGLVTLRGKEIKDEHHIAAVSAHSLATFTEVKQAIEWELKSANHSCVFEEFELGCFVSGRAAKVIVDGVQIGFCGEFHPEVLEEFGLLVPVVGGELNLSLLEKDKKK